MKTKTKEELVREVERLRIEVLRLKAEIAAMRQPKIEPYKKAKPYVDPAYDPMHQPRIWLGIRPPNGIVCAQVIAFSPYDRGNYGAEFYRAV